MVSRNSWKSLMNSVSFTWFSKWNGTAQNPFQLQLSSALRQLLSFGLSVVAFRVLLCLLALFMIPSCIRGCGIENVVRDLS